MPPGCLGAGHGICRVFAVALFLAGEGSTDTCWTEGCLALHLLFFLLLGCALQSQEAGGGDWPEVDFDGQNCLLITFLCFIKEIRFSRQLPGQTGNGNQDQKN